MKTEGTRCFQVSEDDRSLTITIPVDTRSMRRHMWPALWMVLVCSLILLGLAAGVSFGVASAEFRADWILPLLLVLLFFIVSAGAGHFALFVLWHIFGRETIGVADLRLTVSRRMLLLRHNRSFRLDRIERMKCGEVRAGFWALAENPQPLSTGEVTRLPLPSQVNGLTWMQRPYPAIAITSEGKTHHFAVGVTGENVVEILHCLAQWLPEGVVRIPGGQGDDEACDLGGRLPE